MPREDFTAQAHGAAIDAGPQSLPRAGDASAVWSQRDGAEIALRATVEAATVEGWTLERFDGITARLVLPSQRGPLRVFCALLFSVLVALPVWLMSILIAGPVGAILSGVALGVALCLILGPGQQVRVLSIVDFLPSAHKNAGSVLTAEAKN